MEDFPCDENSLARANPVGPPSPGFLSLLFYARAAGAQALRGHGFLPWPRRPGPFIPVATADSSPLSTVSTVRRSAVICRCIGVAGSGRPLTPPSARTRILPVAGSETDSVVTSDPHGQEDYRNAVRCGEMTW